MSTQSSLRILSRSVGSFLLKASYQSVTSFLYMSFSLAWTGEHRIKPSKANKYFFMMEILSIVGGIMAARRTSLTAQKRKNVQWHHQNRLYDCMQRAESPQFCMGNCMGKKIVFRRCVIVRGTQ